MIIRTVETTLSDDSKVFDIEIGDDYGTVRIPCVSERDHDKFKAALAELIKAHAVSEITEGETRQERH